VAVADRDHLALARKDGVAAREALQVLARGLGAGEAHGTLLIR
jgi:hypothetical protein